jgi:predicted XRE-type DNA-binding protein
MIRSQGQRAGAGSDGCEKAKEDNSNSCWGNFRSRPSMNQKTTMQEKINLILQKTGWNQAELAQRLDVSQAQVSNLLGGQSGMSAKTEKKLNELFARVKRYEFRMIASSDVGSCWIRLAPFSHGAQNLSQTQFDAFKKACLAADPLNGQDMAKVRYLLEKAGFTIEFE